MIRQPSSSAADPRTTRTYATISLSLVVWALLMPPAGQAAAQGASVPEQRGLYTPGAAQQSPPLRVEVLDGTSFRDIETGAVFRLYGIDACAPAQRATLGRQPWPCGVMATAWLVAATLNRWVACNSVRESNGTNYARCASSQHPDIAADMVRDGVAVTVPASPDAPAIRAYVALEEDARKAYRGIWASSFQMPWEFRAATIAPTVPSPAKP
jgi:endonuclease YncB( thermonuclease family)